MTLDNAPSADGTPAAAASDPDGSSGPFLSFASPRTLFVLITGFVIADVAADVSDGITATHLSVELMALAFAIIGIAGAVRQLRHAVVRARDLQRDLSHTQRDLSHTRADRDRWREEAEALLHGLGSAIERQFQRWELTRAEGEIALLVLKGLSYKEIAQTRGTAERTVRHQALAIYRKAGLAGRAEMSAFFMQDLLLPAREEAPSSAEPRDR